MPFLYPCVPVPPKFHKAAPESSSLYALELGMPSVLNRKVLGPWQQLGQTNAGPVRVSVRAVAGRRAASLKQHSGSRQPCGHRPGPTQDQTPARSPH